MKKLLLILPFMMLCGCTIIPNDMGYPTFHSYNSPEAKAYREQKAQEKAYKKVGEQQAKEWGSGSSDDAYHNELLRAERRYAATNGFVNPQ